jgi:hypothetical protein
MKHGDIKTMKGDSLESIFSSVKSIFLMDKHPVDENKIKQVAEYFYALANGTEFNLKSLDWSVSTHKADRNGTIKISTIRDVLFTVGITDNIDHWSEQLDLLNRVEYTEHSDDFEDPFIED